MKRILVSGSCGFVGWHAVSWFLEHTDWEIVGIDSFRHAGDSLRAVYDRRYQIYCHDLNAPIGARMAKAIGPVDYILNLASNSDVMLSISDPAPVWENNVRLIGNILEYARQAEVKAFIQCSTDEVYGPAPEGTLYEEWSPPLPSNPYSASKAAQEQLCISYWRTFGIPVLITSCMNMIGERQEPTKYLPMLIRQISQDKEVLVHGRPGLIGSRIYLDAKNAADAWLFLLRNHNLAIYKDGADIQYPSRFNIAGLEEVSNLDMALRVAELIGKPLKYRLEDVHCTRPGHDRRYALDGSKLESLGWRHPIPFETTLRRVVEWTLANREWI